RRVEERLELRVPDRLDEDPEEEAIREGVERVVLRRPVRRPDAHPERRPHLGVPSTEGALVQQREERVQDRRRAEEDLVEERDLPLRKHSGSVRLDDPLAELSQIDRPEDLRGLGEPAEQILEEAPAEARGHAADGLALGGAGRTDDEEVLAG